MATPFRLKRSAVNGKRPGLSDLQLGELALNTYDGSLFVERDTGGVGIATTIANITPWVENYGSGTINYVGVVSATTYHGNQVIGTPTNGSFRAGAFSPTANDFTKDNIDELNYILGKLVPTAPDTINGVSLSLTGTAGNARLCQGFTPVNNTGGSLTPSAGTQYTRNTDSTITTNYITEYGPGDSGTVTGFVNAVGVGTTTLNISFGLYAVKSDNGTYGALQINNDKDAVNSSRNTGITSLFYEVYDVRLINAASPDGFNKAFMTHGGATTNNVFWYEDPSTVSAPVISFGPITYPSSPTLSYSSGVPHYTQASGNAFTYVLTVTNASGDMYNTNTFLTSDGQGNAFQNSGSKNYTNFAGGTNPPARNYGVGTGVTCLISSVPRNIHATVTSNHFTRYDASTPYGSHNNQRISYNTNLNIMGTSATTGQVDEDNILISSLGTGSGNAIRVNAGATGDTPSPISTTFNSSATPAVYEAIVRGGTLRHDQTNYSTGYLPVGLNLSSGRSGTQYFQVLLTRAAVSEGLGKAAIAIGVSAATMAATQAITAPSATSNAPSGLGVGANGELTRSLSPTLSTTATGGLINNATIVPLR